MKDFEIKSGTAIIRAEKGKIVKTELGWWKAESMVEFLTAYCDDNGKQRMKEMAEKLERHLPFEELKGILTAELKAGKAPMWSVLYEASTLDTREYMAKCTGASRAAHRIIFERMKDEAQKLWGRHEPKLLAELAPKFGGEVSGCTGYVDLPATIQKINDAAREGQKSHHENLIRDIWERTKRDISKEEAEKCT